MRYDWNEALEYPEFSKEFYAEVDRRFFENARAFLPWSVVPFDSLIDFDSLPGKDVLEIGVGNGSHAQLLASHAGSFIGIDITDYAVKSTAGRMRCSGLQGRVCQMDAEQMAFGDATFDFIWSWGVIHHSANTRRALQEIHRVLKPGGKGTFMVYHRSVWTYYITGAVVALLRGDALRAESLHSVVQRFTDGAIARYYSVREWRRLISEFFPVNEIRIMGQKTDLIPLPAGRLKAMIMGVIPDSLSRFITNRCGLGGLLVSRVVKSSGAAR
jgi:ubiquinone/menaquinone biosynthesis C-methylase UbiE